MQKKDNKGETAAKSFLLLSQNVEIIYIICHPESKGKRDEIGKKRLFPLEISGSTHLDWRAKLLSNARWSHNAWRARTYGCSRGFTLWP